MIRHTHTLAGESDGEMRVCAVGLHCCGDLTPDLLRMVSGQVNPDLCALVMVGCCYHKMSLRGNVCAIVYLETLAEQTFCKLLLTFVGKIALCFSIIILRNSLKFSPAKFSTNIQ